MKTFFKKIITNKYLSGIIFAAGVALPAWFLGQKFPIVGSPVFGILFGMLIALGSRPESFNPGIKFTSKNILQYSIILLGFDMNLYNVFKVGEQTLFLMLFTLAAAFITAFVVGKALKINSKTTTLIGVGSAICGGSAIAATAPVIDADDDEVAHAISTIFFFNILAAFIFPALGHLMGMSDKAFGLFAGTAVNDTSSVVAAGYAFSDKAGDLAVIVKLTRTLAIVPVTLVLAFFTLRNRKKESSGKFNFAKVFPWFVLGFIAASVIYTFVPMPKELSTFLVKAGKYMIVMAMAAIGMNTNLVKLVKSGTKPLVLGFICWIVISVTSLVVQNAFHLA